MDIDMETRIENLTLKKRVVKRPTLYSAKGVLD